MSVATTHFAGSDLNMLLCQPGVLADLIDACLKQQNSQVLADIVLQDAPLAVLLLSAAEKLNIALNADEPVSSAIQSLDPSILTSLVLHAAQRLCQKKFSDTELVFQYRLWLMSQIGGIFSRCLAPSVNFSRIEEAQLCGLLLNLGIHLLFHAFGKDYLAKDLGVSSSPEQAAIELEHFGMDHLSVADQLISNWHLDSFLADAVRFLHADINQIADSHVLLKIGRLTQQFCLTPDQLSNASQLLAEQLLGLKPSESQYLFHWGRDLFPPAFAWLDQPDKVRGEFNNSIGRLQELTFLLAGQEAARGRLSRAAGRDDLLQISRQLLLEQSPAREAFFFLLDEKSHVLTGMLSGGELRLARELEIPLRSGYSLVSDSYLEKRCFFSFSGRQSLTVTDNLLLRLGDGKGFICCPLGVAGQIPGVVVLKLAGERDLPDCKSQYLQGLIQIVGSALLAESENVFNGGNDGGGFLYQVGQEVKNPLTIINNYVEVLTQTEHRQEQLSLATAIKGEVRRIDAIFQDYLSRHEDHELFDQGVDLNQLVREISDSLRGTCAGRLKVDFDLALQEGLERFQCNSALMRRIVMHLLNNALESFEEAGVIKISTRLVFVASRQWQVELVIQDNGPGLSIHVQKNLFKPVFSPKGAGHAGVGLYQVNAMVSELNGQLSCHSSAVHGTCFTIQIPYRRFESDN